MRRLNSQHGFSFIEILVTLGITIIGLVGLASLQLQTSRAVHDTGNRSHAVWLAEDLVNRIRANRISIESYDTDGGNVACGGTPNKICGSYHNGNDVVNADPTCNGDELAVFDLWEVACGYNAQISDTLVRSAGADYLPGANVAVNMEVTDIPDNEVDEYSVTITIGWDGRTSGQNLQGDTIYADTGDIVNGRSTLTLTYNL